VGEGKKKKRELGREKEEKGRYQTPRLRSGSQTGVERGGKRDESREGKKRGRRKWAQHGGTYKLVVTVPPNRKAAKGGEKREKKKKSVFCQNDES